MLNYLISTNTEILFRILLTLRFVQKTLMFVRFLKRTLFKINADSALKQSGSLEKKCTNLSVIRDYSIRDGCSFKILIVLITPCGWHH